ncbi:MAG: hypothetical protein EOO03_01785 [Chitinophagaceae bacterium]|nr:MAG: hypothetical protein EOO03_01785 [Chitinophagaceae bacterium]
MKKQILLLIAAITLSITASQAQNFQRQTPEERTATALEKLQPLKLTTEQTPKVNSVFLDLYTTQQKAMAEMRASGSMDREAIMAKRKELQSAADAKLKSILNEAQYKQWKEMEESFNQAPRRNNQ